MKKKDVKNRFNKSDLTWEHDVKDLPPALKSVDEIRELIADKDLFVSLDYDGTLTPIVERPELAVLSNEMRSTLTALSDQLISGRDLGDIKGLVGIEGLFYAGSHGFDISGPEGRHIASQQGIEFLPVLDTAEKALHTLLDNIAGVLVERKKFSVAVHRGDNR